MSRGGLTKSDREWLRGERTYADDSTRLNKKERIRERVLRTIKDFELLTRELPESDRKKIFESLSKESDSSCADEISHVFEFVYSGLADLSTDPELLANRETTEAVDRMLAFRRALVWGLERSKENFDQPRPEDQPEKIIISSNAYLHEFPLLDEARREMDTDIWREINEGSGHPGDITEYEDVLNYLALEINAKVHEHISARHEQASKELKDYDLNI